MCDLEFLQRFHVIPIEPIITESERVVGLAKVRLQLQGKQSFGARGLAPCLSRFEKMIDARARHGETGVSERKLRIERNRLKVKLLGGPVILQERVGFEFEFLCLEVKIVSLGILSWLIDNALSFVRRHFRAQRRGNLLGNLAVNT